MICSFSNIEENTLNEIKTLEDKLGKSLLAFSCQDIKTPQLDASELEEIQSLEKKLGVALVAVNA